MRVMICMLTATYAESRDLDANLRDMRAYGPMENGITYIVRPRMHRRNRRFSVWRISRGSIQLFVRPALNRLFDGCMRGRRMYVCRSPWGP